MLDSIFIGFLVVGAVRWLFAYGTWAINFALMMLVAGSRQRPQPSASSWLWPLVIGSLGHVVMSA